MRKHIILVWVVCDRELKCPYLVWDNTHQFIGFCGIVDSRQSVRYGNICCTSGGDFFERGSFDVNDVLREVGILEVTAFDVWWWWWWEGGGIYLWQLISLRSIDSQLFSGPFNMSTCGSRSFTRFESASRLLNLLFSSTVSWALTSGSLSESDRILSRILTWQGDRRTSMKMRQLNCSYLREPNWRLVQNRFKIPRSRWKSSSSHMAMRKHLWCLLKKDVLPPKTRLTFTSRLFIK